MTDNAQGGDAPANRMDLSETSLADVLEHGRPIEIPPPDTDIPMITCALRLPLHTSERLDRAAAQRGLTAGAWRGN